MGRLGLRYDREKKSWSELQAQLPPYPKQEQLIQFDAGSATPHRFFVDPASISIGDDQVVRYTLVVRTAGGRRMCRSRDALRDARAENLCDRAQRRSHLVEGAQSAMAPHRIS